MYTSDTDIKTNHFFKTAFVYLLISLFCILFGAIYELYSHEVYSYYMIYAFLFPLAGGTLPFSMIALLHSNNYPIAFARHLYHAGIATLTVGSVIRGVLDIYGTTNTLSNYYWLVGFSLIIVATITFVIQIILQRSQSY